MRVETKMRSINILAGLVVVERQPGIKWGVWGVAGPGGGYTAMSAAAGGLATRSDAEQFIRLLLLLLLLSWRRTSRRSELRAVDGPSQTSYVTDGAKMRSV
jgi:hypothetical protein